MQLIEFFIRNPVKVTVGVLLMSLFGVVESRLGIGSLCSALNAVLCRSLILRGTSSVRTIDVRTKGLLVERTVWAAPSPIQ